MKEIEKFINYIKYEKRFSDHTSLNYQKDLIDFIEYENKAINNILTHKGEGKRPRLF